MTLTRRKKRIKEERLLCNPKEKCMKCGVSIKKTPHHLYCPDCWPIVQMNKISTEIDIDPIKMKKIIQGERHKEGD